jgi:flagellar hook-length control protein FliK
VPSGNDGAAPDVADSGKEASNNTSAAAVAAAIVDLSGSASANGATPVAAKPAAEGKDDDKDQQSGSADAATVSPAANQAQLPSPDAAQPVAVAVVVNAAPDAVPAAKPGLTIADAVKARVKVTVPPGATEQTTAAQDDTAGAPGSSSAVDAGGSNASQAGPNDATADGAAGNLQQAIDQAPVPGTNGSTFLGQIDFASLGGTEHFVSRGDAATSPGSTPGSVAPNAAMAPNFGIFAPGAVAANVAAPAAAAPEAAVPLAGLAVAIAGRAQAGASQFDIRLDPPELGRIDVRLDVDGSGQVRTHVTVDRADTLQLLQSQQPQLERALEQAGLKTADNGLQFTLRDQSFAGQNGGTGGQQYTNHPAAPLVIPDIDAAPIDTAQIYARLRLGNGLDISV